MATSTEQGRKHDSGKPRWDLLPAGPLLKLVEVYTIGAAKYDDRNWENGLRWGRVFRALLSHAFKWWAGEQNDQEDGQHHLASVAWCAMALMQYEHTHPDLDDRPWPSRAQRPLSEFTDQEIWEEANDRNLWIPPQI